MPFHPRGLILLAVLVATGIPDACATAAGPVIAHSDPDADAAAAAWEVGSEWTFIAGGADGSKQTFVVRVTDRPWGHSGRWYDLDFISDPRPGWTATVWDTDGTVTDVQSRFSAAASVEGRRLEITLTGMMKDVSDRLVGDIDGDRFRGERRSSNMIEDGERIVPGVIGWRSGRVLEPMTGHWRPGAVWTFVLTYPSRRGAAKSEAKTMTFRVTDRTIDTCTGDMHQLELLPEESSIGTDAFNSPPAWTLDGDGLRLELSTGMCDSYDTVTAEIAGGHVVGERSFQGLGFVDDDPGAVRGWRVR